MYLEETYVLSRMSREERVEGWGQRVGVGAEGTEF